MRIQQLGYVAQGKRKIQPMGAYAQLVEKGTGSRAILMHDGSVEDTIGLMKQMVAKYSYQVKRLAKELLKEAGGNPNSKAFYKRIFDFCYTHIQYKEDEQGVEQLREPAKAIKDAVSGIDCDCYSILVASLLKEAGCTKPIEFKIIKINNGRDFQHVYVIVDNYIIDPVVDEFNSEAKGITERKLFGLNGVNGIPIQQLGQIIIDENTLIDGQKIDTTQYKVEVPTNLKPLFAAAQNPFTVILENAFKGTSIDKKEPVINPPSKPNVSIQTGKTNTLVNAAPIALPNKGGNTRVPSIPTNLTFGGIQDNLNDFANEAKDKLNKLPLADLLKTYSKVSEELKQVSQGVNSAAADLLTNEKHIQAGTNAVNGTFTSIAGSGGLISASAPLIAGGLASAGVTVSVGAIVATGGIIIAVAGVIYGIYKLLPDDTQKAIGEGVANFGDWVSGKGPSKMTFNNFEGWEAKDVDVNVYGDQIRGYREGMTGDKSGLGIVEHPSDYLPILLTIYKAAPLPVGGQFEVNPEIATAHSNWQKFMIKKFGTEFWKVPAWGKYRAFMCAPFIAEIVYKEKYETWKLKNKLTVNATVPNYDWARVDNLYLNDQINAVQVLLTLTKKKELDYETLRQQDFPIEPSTAAGFQWIGGQNGGSKAGIMTNAQNIAFKPGDKVQITVTDGDTSYNGIHTVAYLGTDDGKYKENLVTINTKATGKPAKGNIKLLNPINLNGGANTANMGWIFGTALGLIGLAAIIGKKSTNN
jgi:hypothetical protein